MCSNEVARRRVSSLICNLRCGGAQRTARPTDTRTFARAPHGRATTPVGAKLSTCQRTAHPTILRLCARTRFALHARLARGRFHALLP